jgi:hypothetical protein
VILATLFGVLVLLSMPVDSSLSIVIIDGSWHRCQQQQPLAAADDHAAGLLDGDRECRSPRCSFLSGAFVAAARLDARNVIDAGYGLRGGRFLGSGAGCSFHCA